MDDLTQFTNDIIINPENNSSKIEFPKYTELIFNDNVDEKVHASHYYEKARVIITELKIYIQKNPNTTYQELINIIATIPGSVHFTKKSIDEHIVKNGLVIGNMEIQRNLKKVVNIYRTVCDELTRYFKTKIENSK